MKHVAFIGGVPIDDDLNEDLDERGSGQILPLKCNDNVGERASSNLGFPRHETPQLICYFSQTAICCGVKHSGISQSGAEVVFRLGALYN